MTVCLKKVAVGVVLCLLGASLAHKSNAEDWVYSVRNGDTLWSLCLEYTNVPNCWLRIGPYNGVDFPRVMAPGTRIKFPVRWLKSPPVPVEVVFVSGEVLLLSGETDDASVDIGSDTNQLSANNENGATLNRPIVAGEKLSIGALIYTGEKSSATLKFADDSILLMEPESTVRLDLLSVFASTGMVDSRVHLRKGAVRTKVPVREPRSRFQVTTPSAVAAVRGTNFRVSSTDGATATRGEVFGGKISVANDVAEQLVPKGFGLVAEKGVRIEKPQKLLAQPEIIEAEMNQVQPAALSWSPLAGASTYRVEILEDNSDDRLVSDEYLEESTFLIDGLPNNCYRLRVSGVSGSALQGLSSEVRRCIAGKIQSPEIQLTGDDKKNPLVQWPRVAGALSYIVEVSESPEFDTLVLSQRVSETSFQLADHKSKNDVYLRVRAVGDYDLESEPSVVATIERSPSRVKEIVAFVLYALAIIAL